jgi:hypothetical protein
MHYYSEENVAAISWSRINQGRNQREAGGTCFTLVLAWLLASIAFLLPASCWFLRDCLQA